ncbi:MAG: HAD hydrolase family protein [Verrucomicrobiae bacterium]|nr:HAD hydrolase family protein [Verrucomicrobiae bacterium]NNJ86563.1 HAD hydrolase family protein [Akkermansiaceae bacterium]
MKKLLIITDVDASFIDENYEYTEALEAVQQLAQLDFPLVFNSSKTLIECADLAKELQLTTPRIAENGGIISVPHDSELSGLCKPSSTEAWEPQQQSMTLVTGLSGEFILNEAHQARDQHGYAFEGFSDWSCEELSKITGLTHDAAKSAKQRHVSEPILWNDTSERWVDFQSQMQAKGIRTLRGGQFIHLMGPSDKSCGLRVVRRLYKKKYPHEDWITVAIGDSANDKSMLESADIGILIPHADGPQIKVSGDHVIHAKYPSSRGWNDAMLHLLSTL